MIKNPLTVQLELTDACNYSCPHCYHLDNNCGSDNHQQPKKRKALGDDEINKVADKIFQSEIFSLIITGGEPLIRSRLCLELVKRANLENVFSSVNTNLSLLNPNILNDFKKANLGAFLVSCPSSDPITYESMTGGGNLDKFLKNLSLLSDSGIHYTVNMVVNKLNLSQFDQTIDFFVNRGAKSFAATPMSYNPSSPLFELALTSEEASAIADQLVYAREKTGIKVDLIEALPKCLFSDLVIKNKPSFMRRQCQAGRTTMSVSCNGQSRPCSHNQDEYGNLIDHELPEVWEKMASWRNKDFIPQKCERCVMISSCLGGCRVNAKAYSGSYKADEPWSKEPLGKKFNLYAPNPLNIKPDTFFSFAKSFRWRQEDSDIVLMCTRTPANTTAVSRELLKFTLALKDLLPSSWDDIAQKCGFAIDDQGAISVMQRLELKEFVFRSEQEKR